MDASCAANHVICMLQVASKAPCPQATAKCIAYSDVAHLPFPMESRQRIGWRLLPVTCGSIDDLQMGKCVHSAICLWSDAPDLSNTAHDGERQSLLGRLHGTMPQGVHRTAEALPSFGQVQHQAPVVISTQVASHNIALSCVMRQRPEFGRWNLWMHF
jgi:hypothetical protein